MFDKLRKHQVKWTQLNVCLRSTQAKSWSPSRIEVKPEKN